MATATLDPAVVRRLNAFEPAIRRVRESVLLQVAASWDALPQIRDREIARWLRMVIPLVEGGQRQVASMTSAYLAAVDAAVRGTPLRPTPISPRDIGIAVFRGVAADEVYRRPAVDVWTALSRGLAFADARNKGRQRALSLVSTDLQLARTHTSRRILSRNREITGYRRKPNAQRACALCLIAARNVYRKEDLMPIHPGCSCEVRPVYGETDPFRDTLPPLDAVHDAVKDRVGKSSADGRTAADYRKLIVTREHGEIGPVLTLREHQHTGPRDL